MDIDIVCPFYNAENYIDEYIERLNKQKNINIVKFIFPVTQSTDKTLEKIKKYGNFTIIEVKKEEFSHSLTREIAMKQAVSDVVIFMTQDVVLEDENALYHLASCIGKNNVIHAFSRQTTRSKGIEKYTREKNYPLQSYIVTKDDIDKMQIKAFYSSDACAAYDRKKFLELGGFDGKKMQVSEDMYYARKAILGGYAIQYCAESIVVHSHQFKLKEVYHRYYDIGLFFKQNPEFKQYKSSGTGLKLAFYIFKRALSEFNFPVLFRLVPDMLARYLGKSKGERI